MLTLFLWFCCLCFQSGHGNFGSVLKGEYTKLNGEVIPVAVKKLKSEEMNNPKVQIYYLNMHFTFSDVI